MFDAGVRPQTQVYSGIRGKIRYALRRVKTNESTILLGDFNAHVENDGGVWKGVIANMVMLTLQRKTPTATVLQQRIMNNFFEHRNVRKCT